ncbi:MAG: tRNA (adenosine(37)-N6)-threonylcarbamoyltransferase complex ATPase subunit type 1 TsaE [Dehalococcoidia bacterium]
MGSPAVLNVLTHSPKETQDWGRALGQAVGPGDLVLLCGELGSGKTCLVQGIARGLDVRDSVRSPTFVLVTEHSGRLVLYHIDLYRLDDPREVDSLGLEEYVAGDGVCVVEWADKAMSSFPQEYLLVELEYRGTRRRMLTLTPHGDRYAELLKRVRQSLDVQ